MARFARTALLAWWFASVNYQDIISVVGPFPDEQQCKQAKDSVMARTRTAKAGICWWDGKP